MLFSLNFQFAIIYFRQVRNLIRKFCHLNADVIFSVFSSVNFEFLEKINSSLKHILTNKITAKNDDTILGWDSNLHYPMRGSNYHAGDLILGFYGGLWAYSGWDVLNYSTGEIAKPKRCQHLLRPLKYSEAK